MKRKIPARLSRHSGRLEEEEWLKGCELDGADLGRVSAPGVRVEESRLARVNMQGSRLPRWRCSDAEFLSCNLANLDTGGGSFVRVGFIGSKLSGCRFSDALIRDVEFQDCKMDFSSFFTVKLRGVTFVNCELQEAEFQGAEFENVTFDGCNLDRAACSHARFHATEFRNCTLRDFRGLRELAGATFARDALMELAEQLALELGWKIVD
jgi:uncharacterized protein YjbI with pentapeptide repeats